MRSVMPVPMRAEAPTVPMQLPVWQSSPSSEPVDESGDSVDEGPLPAEAPTAPATDAAGATEPADAEGDASVLIDPFATPAD